MAYISEGLENTEDECLSCKKYVLRAWSILFEEFDLIWPYFPPD